MRTRTLTLLLDLLLFWYQKPVNRRKRVMIPMILTTSAIITDQFLLSFSFKELKISRQGTNIIQKLFQCTKCGKSYTTKSNMKRHFEKECGIEPHFHCSECEFRTFWKRNFQNHLIKMHNVDQSQLATHGAGIIFSSCCDDFLLQNAMPSLCLLLRHFAQFLRIHFL